MRVSTRMILIIGKLMGTLAAQALLLQNDGSAKSNNSDDGCATTSLGEMFFRSVVYAAFSILLAKLPVLVFASLCTRKFVYFDGATGDNGMHESGAPQRSSN